MDAVGPSPELTPFAQWRMAASKSHAFELGLTRKALNAESDAFSDDEWREAQRLRSLADHFYRLFMSDIDSKIRNLRECRKASPRPHIVTR